jgi:outer membrane protein assembly factor BamA
MVSTTSHGWMRGRLDFGAHAGWRDATQVEYFGLGIDTSPDAVANFRLQETYAGGVVNMRPQRWIALSGGADYQSFIDKTGEGSSPSIEQSYSPATAPALGDDPAFLHVQAAAGIDTRTSPGYSRVGGYYGATLHAWTGLDAAENFEHLQVDAIQHVPILRETWVLSVRGQMITTLGDNDVVPYFLSPSLGGGHTLRAYGSRRFRDRHTLLASAEWRWIPSYDGLDLAIFYDAGEVASRREDLDFEGWKHNWGVGARFHGPMATPLRIEMARGSEGWQLVFAGSAAF